MSSRAAITTIACVIAVAILAVVAFASRGEEDDADAGAGYPESQLSVDEATAPLPAGTPPELREIRADANQVLDGGLDAFEERLAELEGTPVVINKWASWCGPCIYEFPHFQAAAAERGTEVAFLGVDFDDGDEAAATFLERLPVPFPSYADPDGEISRSLEANYPPTTVFVGADGEIAYRKIGPYESTGDLLADIDRYAAPQ
jgi:cytochrome c biogenesis protein CcmG/thiol:disulfide interchange protein DsbE